MPEDPSFPSTVFGPTCDGLDTLLTEYPLPELQVGVSARCAACGRGTRLAARARCSRRLPPACAAAAGISPALSSSQPVPLPPPPPALQVGDWLLFPSMGAYTLCGASRFNGIDATAPATFYVASHKP